MSELELKIVVSRTLEHRADVILYRICFSPSLGAARQFISHGFVSALSFRSRLPFGLIRAHGYPFFHGPSAPGENPRENLKAKTGARKLRSTEILPPGTLLWLDSRCVRSQEILGNPISAWSPPPSHIEVNYKLLAALIVSHFVPPSS